MDGSDQRWLRACIKDQRCPWCGRKGLRSLSSHTVRVHGIYADQLRELAGLRRGEPLCSPQLSETHRTLALTHNTTQWLHQPEAFRAAAVTREATYDDEQRKRRIEHLDAVRPKAIKASRRRVRAERKAQRSDPQAAAVLKAARSKAHRALRPGVECPICGAWFCSVVPVGQDYRQRKYCSNTCRSEAFRRLRLRTWIQRPPNN